MHYNFAAASVRISALFEYTRKLAQPVDMLVLHPDQEMPPTTLYCTA